VEDKTNEIKAIPSLLELLDITGCVITIDAMGTQTEIATQIVGKGADYILSLKANHPTLLAEVKAWFDAAQAIGFEGIEHSYDQRVEAGHHRRETRQVWVVCIDQMGGLYKQSQWAGLHSRHGRQDPAPGTKPPVNSSFTSVLCRAMLSVSVGRFDNTGALKTNSIGY